MMILEREKMAQNVSIMSKLERRAFLLRSKAMSRSRKCLFLAAEGLEKEEERTHFQRDLE